MTDPEGVIRYWNPAATTIFGYTEAEAIGRGPFTFLIAPGKADELLAEYRAWQSTGTSDLVTAASSAAVCARTAIPSRWSGRWPRCRARAGSGPARC